jgi:hypothetical protein
MRVTLLYPNLFLPQILSYVTFHCAYTASMNINCPSTRNELQCIYVQKEIVDMNVAQPMTGVVQRSETCADLHHSNTVVVGLSSAHGLDGYLSNSISCCSL